MKTLIILMFVMLIVLLALNVTLYIRFNKRVNRFEDLFISTFKPFSSDITSVYSHINSIYSTIKTLSETVTKHKALLDAIDMRCSTMVSNISAYVHKDNDTNKKELINCMANSFTDMMSYISNTVRNANKEIVLNINKEIVADNKHRLISIQLILDNIQKALIDANPNDNKVVSSEELTKISSMLKDTQNQLDCISKQIEACNKLKTATKSKSTKSDKPEAKKKAPLL